MVKTSKFETARWLRGIATGVVLGLAVGSVSALTIVRNFVDVGGTFPAGGTGTAGPATSGGGGNLINIFNLAADWWEAAIQDSHTVTLAFGWGSGLGGTTLGAHNWIAEGGVPIRETEGQVRFNNSFDWFMDADPLSNAAYGTYTETDQTFGAAGDMNVGRVYTDAIGDAIGRTDLFTVALHEIAHALGMSSSFTPFQTENLNGQINLTGPLPFAGAALPTISGAHLNIGTTLMAPTIGLGTRKLMSDADILANCQLSQFTQCVLNPQIGEIPTPGTLALVGISLVGLGWVSRRQRRLH